MLFYELLKRRALTNLPRPVLAKLRRHHYLRLLQHLDESQEPDLAIVRALVRPGDTVVDLGANFGIYTHAMARLVTSAGRVLSVEPMPETFDVLACARRTLPDWRCVELVHAAVSDHDGTISMAVPRGERGGANLYRAHVVTPAAGERSVCVPARTLDGLLQGAPSVRFVKCDVENHELAVLDGATETLHRHHPAWLIEVWDDADERDSHASTVFSRFRDEGYVPYVAADGGIRHRRPHEIADNYVFLMPAHVDELRTAGALSS